MSDTFGFDEERLGELRVPCLRRPPRRFEAAQELPAARSGIDEIVERARVDSEFRARLVADLEAAVAAAGYEPSDELLERVRACLPELDR